MKLFDIYSLKTRSFTFLNNFSRQQYLNFANMLPLAYPFGRKKVSIKDHLFPKRIYDSAIKFKKEGIFPQIYKQNMCVWTVSFAKDAAYPKKI